MMKFQVVAVLCAILTVVRSQGKLIKTYFLEKEKTSENYYKLKIIFRSNQNYNSKF